MCPILRKIKSKKKTKKEKLLSTTKYSYQVTPWCLVCLLPFSLCIWCVLVCLSPSVYLSLSPMHKHQKMLCYKSWSTASLGQHSGTCCLSYSEEKVSHFKSQKWMSGKLHVANKDKCSLLILTDISSGPSATYTLQSCGSVIFFPVIWIYEMDSINSLSSVKGGLS